MDRDGATTKWAADGLSRFEFAPPRHFLLPVIILLLSEHPGYGYNLVKELHEFRFGQVDRPAVYRALAQLERDGLVESKSEAPKAGQARRVYQLTEPGERVLRVWMGVIKEERDCLERVLRRYLATKTTDAALAEVEGGWAAALGQSWSPVSPLSPPSGSWKPRSDQTDAEVQQTSVAHHYGHDLPVMEPGERPALCRFQVRSDRSVVLIEARSTVGPISFGAIGITGYVDAEVYDGAFCTESRPAAHLEVEVASLRSGNSLYDAELFRRIDARRFPTVAVDLRDCTEIGSGNRYRLAGEVTFHGLARPVQGTVSVTLNDRKLVVTGEQVLDIRDFDLASPTVLMLRIYPDVRVRLQVEAELEDDLKD
jgi:DNA-binding PadR family transcriptional regulator